MRADQKPREQESHDGGKADLLAEIAAYAGKECDDGQVLNEIEFTHAMPTLTGSSSCLQQILPPESAIAEMEYWSDEVMEYSSTPSLHRSAGAGPPFDEDGGRPWWDDKDTGGGIVTRMTSYEIGRGVLQDRVQFQRNTGVVGESNSFLNFVRVKKDH